MANAWSTGRGSEVTEGKANIKGAAIQAAWMRVNELLEEARIPRDELADERRWTPSQCARDVEGRAQQIHRPVVAPLDAGVVLERPLGREHRGQSRLRIDARSERRTDTVRLDLFHENHGLRDGLGSFPRAAEEEVYHHRDSVLAA